MKPSRPLRIAVASGKGGTGKTTVATNLALVLGKQGRPVCYLDCDVEEPNGHLFLRPKIEDEKVVNVPVPEVDPGRCVNCGLCAEVCRFGAIASVGDKILTFPAMCHSCGGCFLVCPAEAIAETERLVGVVEKGQAGPVIFIHGRLRVGEAMSPPLIKAVRRAAGEGAVQVIDVPPGTSCPVIAAIRGADFVVLVTEPTPFGLHDLGLALDMVRELGLPHAIVVNRAEEDNDSAREFCRQRRVKILAEIPDDRRVAEAYSRGKMAAAIPGYAGRFEMLFGAVERMVAR
ncbi:MAG: ATP-binding protein [Thermoanaerobacterales bacterium]|nr:ATP-binding protein [Bacillota bacterium]MDI6906890.1 ATP-binding protein [Thermoanaerobacterales bacterium]